MPNNLQHVNYFNRLQKSFRLKPTQVIILNFVVMILIGTSLVMLPVSTTNNLGLPFIDALFVSTSASCVTGLTVVDLHNDLTVFGIIVMLMLIQVGGLGIMTLATMIVYKKGYEVLGVDKDENVTADLAGHLTQVVSFDIHDARALEQVGIANFDTVVIASKNFESSLMATMLCKKRLGATRIIFSERDMTRRIAAQLVSPNVVALIHEGKTIVPPPKHIFTANDAIFVIGTHAALSKFEQSLPLKGREKF